MEPHDIPIIARSDKTWSLLVALVMLWGFDNKLEVVHGGVKQHLSVCVLCASYYIPQGLCDGHGHNGIHVT